MKLSKLYSSRTCQVYAIEGASKQFKQNHTNKFIIISNCFDSVKVIESDTLDLDLDSFGLSEFPASAYIFTFNKSVSKKVLKALESANIPNKDLPNNGSSAVCLDQYYTSPKINTILKIHPRYNQVHPLFNTEIVIKTTISKLKINKLSDQICNILNDIIKKKIDYCGNNLTVESWLEGFIAKPCFNIYGTCCRYPDTITDNTLRHPTHFKPMDIFVCYDVRAGTYEEESRLFCAIADAFEKPENIVTVYDSYNGILKKIIAELDKKKLKYKVLNKYSISTQYKNIKAINVGYDLIDFI